MSRSCASQEDQFKDTEWMRLLANELDHLSVHPGLFDKVCMFGSMEMEMCSTQGASRRTTVVIPNGIARSDWSLADRPLDTALPMGRYCDLASFDGRRHAIAKSYWAMRAELIVWFTFLLETFSHNRYQLQLQELRRDTSSPLVPQSCSRRQRLQGSSLV
eukprot:s2673_g6.t1